LNYNRIKNISLENFGDNLNVKQLDIVVLGRVDMILVLKKL